MSTLSSAKRRMFLPLTCRRIAFTPKGFTLTELLVVIAIIAVLVALLFPSWKGLQQRATISPCMNHQRQLVSAFLAYAADNQGRLPDIAVNLGGPDSSRWDEKIAEYLNIPHQKFYGSSASTLRCPSAKKGTWFTYGLPYATGDRRVFSRLGQPPSGNVNYKGSQRLINLPASTVLIADAHDPNNITSDLFYSPWGNYPLTSDQDSDGVNDSSGNLPPPRKFNCIDPRHGNSFVATMADGSSRLLKMKEWAETPAFWGPNQ